MGHDRISDTNAGPKTFRISIRPICDYPKIGTVIIARKFKTYRLARFPGGTDTRRQHRRFVDNYRLSLLACVASRIRVRFLSRRRRFMIAPACLDCAPDGRPLAHALNVPESQSHLVPPESGSAGFWLTAPPPYQPPSPSGGADYRSVFLLARPAVDAALRSQAANTWGCAIGAPKV